MDKTQLPTPKFKIGDKIGYNEFGMCMFDPRAASYFWYIEEITPTCYLVSSQNTVHPVPLLIDVLDECFTLYDSPESILLRI